MGGALGKDDGAMNYTERNIYLNSEKTYGRLKPVRPITIHQKALFCLWMIIIFLCILVKMWKFWKWILSKRKQKETISKKEVNMESQKEDEVKGGTGLGNGGNIRTRNCITVYSIFV